MFVQLTCCFPNLEGDLFWGTFDGIADELLDASLMVQVAGDMYHDPTHDSKKSVSNAHICNS